MSSQELFAGGGKASPVLRDAEYYFCLDASSFSSFCALLPEPLPDCTQGSGTPSMTCTSPSLCPSVLVPSLVLVPLETGVSSRARHTYHYSVEPVKTMESLEGQRGSREES